MLFGDEYYIVSNNDLEITEVLNWEKIIEIYNRDQNICVIGPKIVGRDGKAQSPNREMNPFEGMVGKYWVMKPFKWKGDIDYDNASKECYRVSGCFMIIRADQFHKIGGFDEGTFLFYEEAILAEKLLTINAKTYFWNDCVLLHNHSETIRSNATIRQMDQWMFDSMIYYYKKYKNVSEFMVLLSNASFVICKGRKVIRRGIKRLLHL